ncbi:response regulator [Lichenibacterium ramalinae]|uniref:Response regulator n=1 Tax=Lichenibacterium ramalinae TaxID=2316527 RepID=A0A4Q2RE25_9HYPH|nr:response regulator [Lichenibacterium ramalinae]RYB04754.1 response regulator [Lichenibacterium ramalinae]
MTRVLVVDDSSVIRKVARRILEGLSLETAEADSGPAALDACAVAMPDGVLLDWNMPEMDGYAVLKALRRMPGGSKPKVLFCTTENDAAHIAKARQAGADDTMMKPFDKDILRIKMAAVGLI